MRQAWTSSTAPPDRAASASLPQRNPGRTSGDRHPDSWPQPPRLDLVTPTDRLYQLNGRGSPRTVETSALVMTAGAGWPWCARIPAGAGLGLPAFPAPRVAG